MINSLIKQLLLLLQTIVLLPPPPPLLHTSIHSQLGLHLFGDFLLIVWSSYNTNSPSQIPCSIHSQSQQKRVSINSAARGDVCRIQSCRCTRERKIISLVRVFFVWRVWEFWHSFHLSGDTFAFCLRENTSPVKSAMIIYLSRGLSYWVVTHLEIWTDRPEFSLKKNFQHPRPENMELPPKRHKRKTKSNILQNESKKRSSSWLRVNVSSTFPKCSSSNSNVQLYCKCQCHDLKVPHARSFLMAG